VKLRRLLVLALALVAWPAAPARAAATDPIAHDPTLIKQGAYYYDVITGDIATRTYLPLRRSRDLVHWEFLGPVFTKPPAWVVDALGTTPGDFWAPDISYFNGRYHLYYAASQFATNNSVIGLATAETLDPAGPEYGWTDEGMVMRSTPGADDFNAIDPDVVFDEQGRLWMAFGSFWSGIKLRRLDPATGKPADDTIRSLASRPDPGAVEGPSIVRRGGFFYLFASFDFCCRGANSDYRVMVGRSRRVTGPYVDRRGVPMLAGGGTELLRGYNEFAGPGHGDVYRDRGVDWFVHHYYDREDPAATPRLSVRAIDWRGGWPRLGDPLSGSREPGRGPAFMRIVNRNSGALLDTPSCGFEGADIRLGGDRRSPCAHWRIEDRGAGWSSLNNQFTNKVAEAAGCATANGADVRQWGWLANACQRFRFLPTGDGFVRIENEQSGRVLDAEGCGGAGANVQLWDWLGNVCQQFRLEPAGRVLLLGVDIRGCRGRCRFDFTHTTLGFSRVTDRRSGRAVVSRRGALRLGGRRRADAWSLTPRNDDTYTLANRAGASYRVKVVRPGPNH
jgi:arabinan endo-1,5-alpha-L-arabinosidase